MAEIRIFQHPAKRNLLIILPWLFLLEFIWSRSGASTFGFPLTPFLQNIHNIITGYAVAFTAIYAIWQTSFLFRAFSPALCWLSQNSLAIYLTHIIPVLLLSKKDLIKTLNYPEKLVFLFGASMAFSIISAHILSKSDMASLILFGRSKIKRIAETAPSDSGAPQIKPIC